jgi:hypothetical protein
MVDKVFEDIATAAERQTGLARRVLDYSMAMDRLVQASKQPGFDPARWNELEAFIARDEFERVGNFKETMSWDKYIGFIARWGSSSEWAGSFKRITEAGNVVFLELEERSGVAGHANTINSCTVYEFNEAGKIRHLDVYLQAEPIDPAMLKAYDFG